MTILFDSMIFKGYVGLWINEILMSEGVLELTLVTSLFCCCISVKETA